MAVYVVTGGAGFIGSHIAEALVRDGHVVRVVDDLSTGSEANLAYVADHIDLIEGDLCDDGLLVTAFSDAECVFHHAAVASVPRSIADPMDCDRVNVQGTLRVLQAARECGVRRVVYASSSAAYGNDPTLPKTEALPPMPASPYAVSKLAGEYYCRAFAEVYGLQTVSLRYFNVFGPRQDPSSQYAAVIPIFMDCVVHGSKPTVFGDGEQTRDFIFVKDVVRANLLAARVPGVAGAFCNIGGGASRSLNELLEIISRLAGRSVEADYVEERPGDVRHSVADVSVARDVLGFEPCVDFEDALRTTMEWMMEQTDG